MFDKLLIAEIGSVHDGSFGNATKLIELAASCGASAVKFQTHISDAESVIDAPCPSYFNVESRFDYFNRTSFSFEQWCQLKKIAESLDLIFLSSPFSMEAVDLLENIGMVAYKIPSGEITNLPLLEKISNLKKPVLLSSGMSNWSELDNAIAVFKEACPLAVMQCSTQYPCQNNNVGINVLQEMKDRYGCVVGFSDHTMGIAAPILAIANGARVIEKHLTFSRAMYGSDAPHSLEPNEFSLMAREIKDAWSILENPVNKNCHNQYSEMKKVFEKVLVANIDIQPGDALTFENVSFKKAGEGISAALWPKIIGLKAKAKILKDQRIKQDDF